MLLNRYADPFLVLDKMITNGMLPEFVRNMEDEINEEKLWQLYLSRALFCKESFNDWKAQVTNTDPESEEKQIQEQENVEATIKHAESILSKFKPV